MVLALSFAVLLSPLVVAILLTSRLSVRAKIIAGGSMLSLLVILPLLYFWFGSSLGL